MLTIGSRGSQLALWQAHWVQARLEALGNASRVEIIKTTGDQITDMSLSQVGAQVGSKGLFTKEIEEALLSGAIDLAVHSLKDMPTELPAGLTLAAIPEREDARDALVGRALAQLGKGARIGTGSLRRAAQLRSLRPDLRIEDIRGNVDTRLRKLDEGQYDAIVLASAGLRRLGWEGRITEVFDPGIMCPAVGQGALAVETRDDSGAGFQAAQRLEHTETRAAVTAERSLLATLGGGCQAPMGAHAFVKDETLFIVALIVSPDGKQVVRKESQGPVDNAAALGCELGEELLAAGGKQILDLVYFDARSQPQPVVPGAAAQPIDPQPAAAPPAAGQSAPRPNDPRPNGPRPNEPRP